MASRKALVVIFIFSLSFVILSVSWLIFHIIGDIGLIFTELTCQFVLAIGCFSFFMAIISLDKVLADIRWEINEVKEKEKNVRDIYQYDQLLNPPIMNN